MVLRMARLIDDAGETSGNVPHPWSSSGHDDAYNGLQIRSVLLDLVTLSLSSLFAEIAGICVLGVLGLQSTLFSSSESSSWPSISVFHLIRRLISLGSSHYMRFTEGVISHRLPHAFG
ncbi:unnamed protein product [Protopolystoma xenopodis]|uniref:Uncharacterized protein n=1 Tax=Protopolystoma xenopodis TaxID=117903 RepID=A0A448WKZ3_9PLAT|nr:unnamed protein product [Protopolystoma xenopodis]